MLERGDRALVTGAAGFIGSAVTRALLAGGQRVVALLEPGADTANLGGLDVEGVEGDLRDPTAVRKAVSGCRAVFHVAALYRFWAPDPRRFYDINVGGTCNVMEAAQAEGTERVVYTGTVGTLGAGPAGGAKVVDEASWPDLAHLFGLYKRSKYVAEHEVLRAAAEGLAVSIVQPTFPLGPGDRAPTPTGRVVLDFLNGRMPAYVETALNVVHVDDLARGHLLALEHGSPGRSYVLGGENLTFKAFLDELAALTGLRSPAIRLPRAVSFGAAWVSELIEGRVLRRHPSVPLEAARMSTTSMAFDDSRARRELGYTSRPAVEAIEASVRWFLDNDYVVERRRSRISLRA